ncbi:MAG: glycoside hydrolase domain-containing protein [Hyalangium sp.]|uniref:DUF4091 domain-containing protein n=1 Tax=Hyalangium sp. TaxID=2028555 RepID=UPI003899FA17
MVKIRPETAPGSERELFLFAGRNEFVSFQVAFHGGQTGWKVAKVSLTDLQGPDIILSKDITLYREALLDIKRPSGVDLMTKGRWPDGLIPDVDEFTGEQRSAFPFAVPPGEARALWVDVHVPEDASVGDYRGVILVTTQDGLTVDLRIHLTVVDALMPSTPSMKTAFFLGPQYVCQAYTGRLDCDERTLAQLLPLFHRLGLEHRISLAGGFPNLSDHINWELQNWTTFEMLWGPFLDGTATLRLPGAHVTAWKFMGPFSVQAITNFAQESRARGWLPRAFDYVGDEPPYWASFDQVRQRAARTRQAAPELRTLLASNIDVLSSQQLEEVIDIIAVLVNHIDRPPPYGGDQRPRYEEFLSRPNRELWLYQSCESHGCVGVSVPENRPGQGWPSYMIDRAATKARAMQWLSFLEGATGELYYQTVARLDTAWTDQYLYFGNGDGTLFYPGTPAAIGGTTQIPVPSLRLKLIRLGLQDYEWLKAVSDAGDPDYAQRVARRVLPVAWLVPDDGALFEEARLCLIHRYLELTGPVQPIKNAPSMGVPCPEDFDVPPEGG